MKFKGTYFLVTLCVIGLVVLLANDCLAQCAMCRKIATDGVNAKTAGASLNHAILYLLALPYLGVAFFFRKQIFDFISRLVVRAKK